MDGIALIGLRPRPGTLHRHDTAPVEHRADNSAQCPSCERAGYDAAAGYCPLCGYAGINSYPLVAQRASHPILGTGERCGHCGGVWPNCCLYGLAAANR